MRRILVVAVCSSLVLASSLRAQAAADSSAPPFHPGQWGVQFVAQGTTAEGGALRFSTPTRAWVLDASGNFARETTSGPDPALDHSSAAVTAYLGPRWYHTMHGQLVRFIGTGLTGAWARQGGGGDELTEIGWSLGAYGEVGATYMFTPHIGVGSRAFLTVTRGEDTWHGLVGPQGPFTQGATIYHAALSPVQILGAIYF